MDEGELEGVEVIAARAGQDLPRRFGQAADAVERIADDRQAIVCEQRAHLVLEPAARAHDEEAGFAFRGKRCPAQELDSVVHLVSIVFIGW